MGDNGRFYGPENESRMIALNYCYCHALCYCDRFLLRAWDFYNFHSVYNPSYSIRVLYCHLLSQQYSLSTIIILIQKFCNYVFVFSLEIERLQRVQEELADEIRTLRKHPDTVVTLLPPLVPNSPLPFRPRPTKTKVPLDQACLAASPCISVNNALAYFVAKANKQITLRRMMLQGTSEVVRDVTSHGKLLSQNVDLRTQLRTTELERNKFKHEGNKVGNWSKSDANLN